MCNCLVYSITVNKLYHILGTLTAFLFNTFVIFVIIKRTLYPTTLFHSIHIMMAHFHMFDIEHIV